MGIIAKFKDRGLTQDVYYKLDSIRAGMGHGGTIACNVTVWANAETRALDKTGAMTLIANHTLHIPDGAIQPAESLIASVYPLLQAYLDGIEETTVYSEDMNKEIAKDDIPESAGDIPVVSSDV